MGMLVAKKQLQIGTTATTAMAGNATPTPGDATVTTAKFAAAAIDPAVGVAGARTLGNGALQAKPGNAGPRQGVAKTARYYHTPGGGTTQALAAGGLYLLPFWLPNGQDMTIDRVSLGITAAGAGGTTLRLCAYDVNQYLEPAALLWDFGTIAGDAITDALEITPASARLLTSAFGAVALGVFCLGGTPTIRAINGMQYGFNCADSLATINPTSATCWRQTGLAALPDPFAGSLVALAGPKVVVRST